MSNASDRAESPSARLQVFLCHSSHDKPQVRGLARRLGAMGIDTWLDEEGIRTGERFPDRIGAALQASSHLLVWFTEAWRAGRWTWKELEAFAALERGIDQVIVVLPSRAEIDSLPPRLTDRSALTLADHSDDELDWLIHCAVHGTDKGTRVRWEARAHQVRDRVDHIPDFSREELLEAAGRILHGLPGAEALARNVMLHCLRIGVSPTWVEDTLPPERCLDIWARALDATPMAPSTIWPRLALAAERAGALPPELTAAKLLDLVFTSMEVSTVTSALRMLALLGPPRASVLTLISWVDPDQDPDAPRQAIGPGLRGDRRVLDTALGLLFSQPDVRPELFFRGFAATMVGDAQWWAVYFRHLISLTRAGRLQISTLSHRLEESLAATTEDPEQLLALCAVLDEIDELALPLEAFLQRLFHRLRHRPRAPWLAARLQTAQLILERHHRSVFMQMWPVLHLFKPWEQAMEAARLTGIAAQEVSEVEELLARFARRGAPEEQALLFEAALGSPANVDDIPGTSSRVASSLDHPDTRTEPIATLLSGAMLRAFQATIQAEDWGVQASRFLEAAAPIERRLWPWVLAMEYASSTPGPTSRLVLERCAAIAMKTLATAACNERQDEALHQLAQLPLDTPLPERVDLWDRAVAVLGGFGAELAARAEGAQIQLRWLQSGLRDFGGPLHRELGGLEGGLRAWFATFPDISLVLAARPAITWRYAVTESREWVGLMGSLESEHISSPLRDSLYPEMTGSRSTYETLMQALHEFGRADRHRSLAHRICVVEEILSWLVRHHHEPGSEGFLWAMLLRKHGFVCPGTPEGRRHRELVEAMLQAYAGAPKALLSSLDTLLLDTDTRLDLVYGLARAQPEAAEEALLTILSMAVDDPAEVGRAAEGLKILAASPPSPRAIPLLRDWVEHQGPPLAGPAAAALLSVSKEPEDQLRVLELALRDPAAAGGLI